MTQFQDNGPRAAPSLPKGSGRKAPRVVLALVILIILLSIVAIVVAVLLFRA